MFKSDRRECRCQFFGYFKGLRVRLIRTRSCKHASMNGCLCSHQEARTATTEKRAHHDLRTGGSAFGARSVILVRMRDQLRPAMAHHDLSISVPVGRISCHMDMNFAFFVLVASCRNMEAQPFCDAKITLGTLPKEIWETSLAKFF